MWPFKKKKSQEHDTQPDPHLKAVWENLDQDLKDFAMTTHDLGLRRNLKIRFNERGMAKLVKQLDEIGYEIRKKGAGH